jgi:transposase
VKFRAVRGIVCRVTSIDLQLAEARAAIADRDAKIETLARDVAMLQDAIKHLLSHRGGGHRVPAGQGLLFPEASSAVDAPKAEEAATDDSDEAGDDDSDEDDSPRLQAGMDSKKRTPRRIDTTGLPREDRVHDVPEDQRVDPVTGQPLVQISEKVFEELNYKRAQLTVTCHRLPIYGLPPAEAEHREIAPVMADLPPRPLENCAASAVLLAWLLVQKYANHLPLYRQEAIFGRDGKRLPRQTLCDWVLASAELLQPIAECLMAKIRAGPVMQLDDTPVMCQGGRGEPNFQACLWTFVNPEVDGVAYRFTPGRASEPLAAEIGNFTGTLVGDGYSGNSAAADKAAGHIAIAGCWAHVTRKFRDAETEAPGTARLFRNDIRKLYEIEREADETRLTPDARTALRQQKAMPILIAIYSRAWRLGGQFSDAGLMAKAIGYIRGQHRPLRQFLEDGRIPLDNNACERAIRPIAIGRRNWLFAGSMRGGRAAAVIYTLIECCRLAKVDMVSYLADVLVRVATHPASRVEDLLPATWATQVRTPAVELAPA